MKTQQQLILAHLQKRKRITSWDAIELYHATRLAAIIYELKQSHNIVAERKHDVTSGKRWAVYHYMGAK